jgi:hypothetical protein
MSTTSIFSVADLAPYLPKLTALGYETVEEFVSAAYAANGPLSDFLETDVLTLIENLPDEVRPKQMLGDEDMVPLSLGVRLDLVPSQRMAFAIALSPQPLPTYVNLIPEMPPVRDQAERGACVAFSTLGAIEHKLRKDGQAVELSPQYLYRQCKNRDGIPDQEGTFLKVAFDVLRADGCCLEEKWPYRKVALNGVLDADEAVPEGAAEDAAGRRFAGIALPPNSVDDIKVRLSQGKCVAFSVPVFPSWVYNPAIRRSGDIKLPIPGEDGGNLGHAMCLVGYEDLPEHAGLGGGRFLVRNSWDSYWATESALGKGYGTIPYAYLARFAKEAYAIA